MNFQQQQQQQQPWRQPAEEEEESVFFIPTNTGGSKNSHNTSSSSSSSNGTSNSTTVPFTMNNVEMTRTSTQNQVHPTFANHPNTTVPGMNPNMMMRDDDRRGAEDVEILTAVALPNTIRPPVIPSNVHPSVLFAKRLGILCSGLFLAFITYLDAYVFFTMNIFHRLSAQLAGIFWAFSCLSLLLGSVVGCYQGKWRYLAPGIVLNHLASVWINLVMEVDR